MLGPSSTISVEGWNCSKNQIWKSNEKDLIPHFWNNFVVFSFLIWLDVFIRWLFYNSSWDYVEHLFLFSKSSLPIRKSFEKRCHIFLSLFYFISYQKLKILLCSNKLGLLHWSATGTVYNWIYRLNLNFHSHVWASDDSWRPCSVSKWLNSIFCVSCEN